MNQKIIVRLFVLVNLLAINFVGPFEFTTVDVVYAQAEIPFLITPYYGKTSITALFDHQHPGYTGEQGDNWIVTFLGRLRSNPDPNVCTGGINGDCYDGHNGVDFGLSYKQILVAVDGLVTKAQWDEVDRFANYGLVVEIEHTINNVKYRTRYGHLSTIAVYTGQTVAAGKILGSSGHTGWSTGPHLHFDIHQWDAEEEKWVPIDPFGWEPETGAEVNVDPWASHMKSWGCVSFELRPCQEAKGSW